jgi:uncharacterized protein with FMN-binding domain
MARRTSDKKVANTVVAMSSAAVLAVYGAGYVRTKSAADRLTEQALERTLSRQASSRQMSRKDEAPAFVSNGPLAAPLPVASARVDPKPATPVAREQIASSAAVTAPVQVLNAGTTPSQAEMPPPIAAPVSAPATVVASIAEPPAEMPAPVPAAPSPTPFRDGKYAGWGRCQHGDIQATLVVEGGRIVSAEISKCLTRYSCDVIEKLPPQVIQRQSHTVDMVGGATESADAFYTAVSNALSQAR